MSSRLIRPAAYFGPPIAFIAILVGILSFRPSAPPVAIPELPYWDFAAPESLREITTRNLDIDHAGLQDPFSSEYHSMTSDTSIPTEHELTMVIEGGSRPCCMINGKLYNLFEKGPGFTVASIGPSRVEIKMDDGSSRRLLLKDRKKPGIFKEGP